MCYAEWWRRDYNGGIPSREDVAVGLGLPHYCWEQLYKAARHGLKSHGFAFIHSLKGNEYFRTLLNQGGLPVNYIKNGTNLSGFSRFLIGLVEELSSINIDWDDNNIDLIKNFNCIAYLGKAFKNDNIYDVSLQIAHAIISEEDRWLPYDDTDSSLSELTKSLKREYRRVKSEHRTKPLSLSWKLRLTSSKTANLFVNLNIVKEISSKSIEGLNYQSCYTFDVFVSGILVGKYVRKSLVKDDKGEVIGAIYSRITVGVANDIKWSGEPVVEVKIRCDNDDRLFPTLCGSYPPNFECPQVFQMLDDNVYSLKSTANAENNIAVFSTNWKCDGSHNLLLNGELYSAIKFTDKVDLHNCMSNEDITITNEFTPYSAEFRGTYIQWVEQSNFKLLTRIPVISVFDQTGTRVGNIKPKYRVHNSKAEWRNLSNSCLLPFGLVDIKVEFPDNKYVMETFYFIDDMTFVSRNETMFSTELHLYSRHVISAKVDECENLSVEMTDKNTWRISRDACASKYSPTCNLKIIAENNPPLKVSVVAPFEGIVISDLEGKIVPSGKIISYDNLRYFNIISHGQSGMIDVTYKSDKIKDDNTIKHLKSPVIEGIVPLSDYRDLFARMFQLYGANTFDRSSSIELKICDKRIYIRYRTGQRSKRHGRFGALLARQHGVGDALQRAEMRNVRLNFRQQERSHLMENMIYNDLIRRGYSVDVGIVELTRIIEGRRRSSQYKIDFVVNVGNDKLYIQSALHVDTPEKKAQETFSLRNTGDFFRKIVVLDGNSKPWTDEDGVMYVGVIPFLLEDIVAEAIG